MEKWYWNKLYNTLVSEEEIDLYEKYNPYLIRNKEVVELGEFETKEDAEIVMDKKINELNV